MAVIDTSGSMINREVLSAIRAEMKRLSRLADILSVECDTKIQREYRYWDEISRVKGGGGTSFREPLSPKFLSKCRIDAVLYFTDGSGLAPKRSPMVPMVWCLLGTWARKPASWGKELRIPDS